MLTRTAFGLALILATASGSLAATRHHPIAPPAPQQNIYNPYGPYIVTDPDPSIRYEMSRDWSHGRY
jgi:hypothetical protein